ncbi:MAG TPA: ABC transporter ATP-binding protein [Candidatus Acidoferrales bacterium]|nr:ABC transporter ATP-binding protein [Candidatus Acidoferrales bacterium]
MQATLEVSELTVELPTTTGWVRPVNGVSFALGRGESLGIVGESGSGKTMLSLSLMGLTPPGARIKGCAQLHAAAPASVNSHGNGTTAQDRTVDLVTASPGEMRAIRGGQIGMIFQEPMTALDPVLRIGDQIEEAIRVHTSGISRAETRQRAIHALERAAVPEAARRAHQYPHELSGGLRQRALIAMALAAGPGVLIADEPTTALDVTVQSQILQLLAELQRELRLSLIFITHDLGVVAQVAERVLVMYAGRVVEQGATRDVLRNPRHPYTEGLLRAAPRLQKAKISPIPGSVPALDALPRGCSFGPRCERHISDCDAAVPEFRPVDDRHQARCILAG